MKILINPRLTFALGAVLAIVIVWCNAFPTRVDAEGMSEAIGGCYNKCENYDSDCSGCDDEIDDCYYEVGDNSKTCKKKSELTGCGDWSCTEKPYPKSCQSF